MVRQLRGSGHQYVLTTSGRDVGTETGNNGVSNKATAELSAVST
jgi:hypothetical protein